MKNMKKAGAAVLMLLSVLALASCSMVFYGTVSGRVVDRETGNGIDGADVYLYLDKGARDSAAASFTDAASFDPSGWAKKVSTNAGNYGFERILWETGSSAYGKEADEKTVYLIIVHDDYGIATAEKCMVSDQSNKVPDVRMDRTTDTFRYVFNFKNADASGTAPNAEWTVTYEYDGKPGYTDTWSETRTVTGGGFEVAVDYYEKRGVPELRITGLTCNDTQLKDEVDTPVWTVVDGAIDEPFKAESAKKTKQFDIRFNELKTDSFTYHLSFRNGGDLDKTAESSYAFTYSYSGKPDTKDPVKEDVVFTGSGYDVTVSFYEGSAVPALTISDVRSTVTRMDGKIEKAEWLMVDPDNTSERLDTVTIAAPENAKDDMTYIVPMEMQWWSFPGFSGDVARDEGGTDVPVPAASSVKIALKSAPEKSLGSEAVHKDYHEGKLYRTTFGGLGNGLIIFREPGDTACGPLGEEYTLTVLNTKGEECGTVDIPVSSDNENALRSIRIEGTI